LRRVHILLTSISQVTAATPETPILGLLFYGLLRGEQGEQLERMAQSDGSAQPRR
jgi:hypothetical protein